MLEDEGRTVEDYRACEAFLEAYRPGREACLLIDAYLPGMSGSSCCSGWRCGRSAAGHHDHRQQRRVDGGAGHEGGRPGLHRKTDRPPRLLASIERALEQSRDSSKLLAARETAADHIAALTPRQRQIMELVLAGHPSKNIAADLAISQRTVGDHRAAIMKKTGTKSLPALARLAVAAVRDDGDEPAARR